MSVLVRYLVHVAVLVHFVLRDACYMAHVAVPFPTIDGPHVLILPALSHRQFSLKHLLQGV